MLKKPSVYNSVDLHMEVELHSVALTFSNTELEKAFIASQIQNLYLPVERWFLYLDALLFAVFFYSNASLDGLPTVVGYVLTFVIHWSVLERTSLEFKSRFRIWILLFLKIVRMALFISIFSWWKEPSEEFSLYITAILRSGVVMFLWYSYGFLARFREMIVMQAFLIVLYLRVAGSFSCEHFLQLKDGRRIILSIWKTAANFLQEHSEPFSQGLEDRDDTIQKCKLLHILSHVHISFLSTLFIIWLMEMYWRYQFVKFVNRARPRCIRLTTIWKPDVLVIAGWTEHKGGVRVCFAGCGLIIMAPIYVLVVRIM